MKTNMKHAIVAGIIASLMLLTLGASLLPSLGMGVLFGMGHVYLMGNKNV